VGMRREEDCDVRKVFERIVESSDSLERMRGQILRSRVRSRLSVAAIPSTLLLNLMWAQTKRRIRRHPRNLSRSPARSIETDPSLTGLRESSEELAFAQWIALYTSVLKRNRAEMELARRRRKD
jgi:hypothetical protein